mmetsp:Transcript_152801/g.292657  ORF Transcript_152801/g.292657 Transcript_152801/m.292657 type:complete len:1092 (-) Transcript_152801:93-3368(-)
MAAHVAEVLGHIHGLHRDFANTQVHSEWLQHFQQAPEAWAVVHELLTSSQDETVQFFASHTLVTKLQAGKPPTTGSSFQEICIGYINRHRNGPLPVRRQLVVALVDYELWQPDAQDERWLTECVQQLSIGDLSCLLELLRVIPEEAANRKVVVEPKRRSVFAMNMLQHTTSALEALFKASQSNEMYAMSALYASARWLHLQHASQALRAQKRAVGATGGGTGPFCAEIVRHPGLHEHPVLLQAAQTLSRIDSTSVELCRACADVLSEAHQLTNMTCQQARTILLLVIQALVHGTRQLMPHTQAHLEAWLAPESELAQRAAVLGRLVGEMGGLFARLTVANVNGSSARAVNGTGAPAVAQDLSGPLQDLADVALHFCALRHTDLAKCGLDFWYGVLAQHLGALAEEDDPFDEDTSSAASTASTLGWGQARGPEQEKLRREEEKPLLVPHVQNMVKAHWRAVRYPSEPEREANFEWDEFVRFRELCAINVTEACVVVGPRWIIDYVGELLEQICTQKPIAWQDIDACVFMLTAVASRAPAGQDTVIPRLIELLPQLPYPTDGLKALLLRCAASRLILFTSGYLALNPEPCKLILRFLTSQHLQAIPPLAGGPDPDTKKYCEAIACDAMKMVMTAARKCIVAADGGQLWKPVVSAVVDLVADSRYNVDCRAQLVFGIGQVLSVLENWNELEQMLGIFVARMEAPLKSIFATLPPEPLGSLAKKTTRDGKAPEELKLYIAAVSSVYNIPARPENQTRPDHHPVLAVVEQHFATIERICVYHTQYEELMEQVCLAFSYILGFAREYAPSSPVFKPMMQLMARCCEYHPQPFYLGLIRSVIGFFAVLAEPHMDTVLVELTGLFITTVARRLGETASGASNAVALMPSINTSGYEMLAEAVRHWNLALLAIRQAPWLPETLDITVQVLPLMAEGGHVVHERTICAMLRFLRHIILWADPQTRAGDNAPELLELESLAKALLTEKPLPGGIALQRIVVVLVRLLAAAAPNGPTKGELVPNVAEVIRALFTGPFEYIISNQLPAALRSLPEPLNTIYPELELQRLVNNLRMEKGDSRRFTRTIIGVAELFAVALKKAQFR